jgi:hypothetical protein
MELLKHTLKTILEHFGIELIRMDAMVETMLYALRMQEFVTEILPLEDPSVLLPRSHIHIIATVKHEENEIDFFGKYFITKDYAKPEAVEAYEATTHENIEKSEELIRQALKLGMEIFRRYIVDVESSS